MIRNRHRNGGIGTGRLLAKLVLVAVVGMMITNERIQGLFRYTILVLYLGERQALRGFVVVLVVFETFYSTTFVRSRRGVGTCLI